MLRSLAPLALSLLLMACGAAGPSAPAKAPETTRAPSQAPKAGETAAKSSNPLAELPPGIPEASADCPARTKVARAACAARGDFTVELAKALSSSGVEQARLPRKRAGSAARLAARAACGSGATRLRRCHGRRRRRERGPARDRRRLGR